MVSYRQPVFLIMRYSRCLLFLLFPSFSSNHSPVLFVVHEISPVESIVFQQLDGQKKLFDDIPSGKLSQLLKMAQSKSFPSYKMVIFQSYVTVYQRVNPAQTILDLTIPRITWVYIPKHRVPQISCMFPYVSICSSDMYLTHISEIHKHWFIIIIQCYYPLLLYGDGSKPYPPGEHQNSW